MSEILADYHMHTKFSPDSTAEPGDMCRAALDRGLTEIAVTDHFEFLPPGKFPDKPYRIENMREQQKALAACREEFAGKLKIRFGIEIGQPQCSPEAAAELMQAVSFDYVIGSVHKMNGLDLGLTEYTDANIPGLVRQDLSMLWDLADREDFDCMGHIDIIKRYAARKGKKIDLMDWQEELEAILRRVIARGKGIEINTSGLRQTAREALPGLRILRFYKELGGEILTVGSDAHRPEDVAADFGQTLELAREAGFRYLACYENRQPGFYSID